MKEYNVVFHDIDVRIPRESRLKNRVDKGYTYKVYIYADVDGKPSLITTSFTLSHEIDGVKYIIYDSPLFEVSKVYASIHSVQLTCGEWLNFAPNFEKLYKVKMSINYKKSTQAVKVYFKVQSYEESV